MANSSKYLPVGGVVSPSNFKTFFSLLKTRKAVALGYGFMLAFVAFTVFLTFSPSPNASSPWFTNIFTSTSSTPAPSSPDFSSLFPRSTSSPLPPSTSALQANTYTGSPLPERQALHLKEKCKPSEIKPSNAHFRAVNKIRNLPEMRFELNPSDGRPKHYTEELRRFKLWCDVPP